MDAYFLDWANLLLRWVHVITAIAWVGFNWRDFLGRQSEGFTGVFLDVIGRGRTKRAPPRAAWAWPLELVQKNY